MKIAIFDYVVTSGNAIGKCDLGILNALCHEHEFTVFSMEFENPCPDRIKWVRVPAVRRPLALVFLTFHILAPIYYLWYRLVRGMRFDLVQFIESNLAFGDIAYAHFCHRQFLKSHWSEVRTGSVRSAFRWLDHWFHALLEPWTFRRARWIVVPSHGLQRELSAAYPFTRSKIRVLPNPVDVDLMERPPAFNPAQLRQLAGFSSSDLVLVFVALGHYERKGLPNLLRALKICDRHDVKVLVVGGAPNLIAEYEARVRELELDRTVVFVGMQADIRPYLWAADALVLPSLYEVFPLVALEGAAAGLPLLVTQLNGTEEFLRDGANGLIIKTHDPAAISECLRHFADLAPAERKGLGREAQGNVKRYNPSRFAKAWSGVYHEVAEWI
jgi:glycosyltransferase involved in cell wall biosynthesis